MTKCNCHFQCYVFICGHLLEVVYFFLQVLLSAVLLSTVPSGCWSLAIHCLFLPALQMTAGSSSLDAISKALVYIQSTLQVYSASQLLCPSLC